MPVKARLGRAVCAAVVCMSLVSNAPAGLLVNGDAEMGAAPDPSGYGAPVGWDASSPSPYAYPYQDQSTGRVYPHGGNFLVSYCWNVPVLWMSQSGTTGLDSEALRLSGWVQVENLGSPPDAGEAIFRILDADDEELASASSGPLTTGTFVWEPFEVVLPVPQNAARWTVEMTGTRNYGSYVNVFFDDLDLTAIPEPTSMALLALGGMALIRRRRAV